MSQPYDVFALPSGFSQTLLKKSFLYFSPQTQLKTTPRVCKGRVVLCRGLGQSPNFKPSYAAFGSFGFSSPYMNSFFSANIRCIMSANFLPVATAAFLAPCLLMIFKPQALTLLHFFVRVRHTKPASVKNVLTSLKPHFDICPCFLVFARELINYKILHPLQK